MTDESRRNAQAVQEALEQNAAHLQPDPFLAQRVMAIADRKSPIVLPKKWALILLLSVLLTLTSLTALASVLLTGHEFQLYEGVDILQLLPQQRQEYDVCHRLNAGYLVGGFELGDDYIAPMDENDSILLLDEHFNLQWSLSDARLTGSLFDRVIETDDALYLGMEQHREDWHPAVMKLGLDGTIHWLYTGNGDTRLRDFAVNDTGQVLCVGSIGRKDTQQAYLLCLNADGQPLQEGPFTGASLKRLSAIECIGGRTLLAGQTPTGAWLGEMRSDGSLIWQRDIPQEEPIEALHLHPTADGSLVLSIAFQPESQSGATRQLRYFVLDLSDTIP